MKFISNFLIVVLLVSCSNESKTLFEDPLEGAVKDNWTVTPDFIDHPEFGKVCYFNCNSSRLVKPAPCFGDENWNNYQIEFEIMITEKKGFVGLDFNAQNKSHYGCNFHFAAFRDTIQLQSMGMWGNSKGSWKLWPVSQKSMVLELNKWLKFRLETGSNVANIYWNDSCIYTIYDLPFTNGSIRFWASYYGSAFYRNIKVKKLQNKVEPVLKDIWVGVRNKNIIREWQITELKPSNYTQNGLPEKQELEKEKWRSVKTNSLGVLNLGEIYPNYQTNTVLAKTLINAKEGKNITCFVTYTDKFRLYCNGKELFKGPDRNWFNPDREKYGNSRLIPDQFKIELPLKEGDNEIIIRSEVMEDFGWGFWMRKE